MTHLLYLLDMITFKSSNLTNRTKFLTIQIDSVMAKHTARDRDQDRHNRKQLLPGLFLCSVYST